jgi:hypothetical protein
MPHLKEIDALTKRGMVFAENIVSRLEKGKGKEAGVETRTLAGTATTGIPSSPQQMQAELPSEAKPMKAADLSPLSDKRR